MQECWAYDPAERPNFSMLVCAIAENLAENAEYFTFSMSPMPLIPQGVASDNEEGGAVISNHSADLERSVSLSDTDSVTS